MRKSVFAALLAVFVGLAASAQDKRAEAILDQVSKKYQNMNAFNAAFTYGTGKGRPMAGTVTVKGVKFKLDMAGQQIYNNGKEIYTYMKDANEVNVTDFNPASDGDFSPSKIYSAYKKGYRYAYKGEQKVGAVTQELIELTPAKAGKVSRVQIAVNKADKSIRSWTVWDKAGKPTAFTITKFTPNVAVADQTFVFDTKKYPGVEVVDLR